MPLQTLTSASDLASLIPTLELHLPESINMLSWCQMVIAKPEIRGDSDNILIKTLETGIALVRTRRAFEPCTCYGFFCSDDVEDKQATIEELGKDLDFSEPFVVENIVANIDQEVKDFFERKAKGLGIFQVLYETVVLVLDHEKNLPEADLAPGYALLPWSGCDAEVVMSDDGIWKATPEAFKLEDIAQLLDMGLGKGIFKDGELVARGMLRP